MGMSEPRVISPKTAAKGEILQIRTLITHQMETGLRRDEAGAVIPRKIINEFVCRYNGETVFRVELHEAVAANPYLEFYVRAAESGTLEFTWTEDGGAVFTTSRDLAVT
jgi:sulfur-oxidizing protein SoxZ